MSKTISSISLRFGDSGSFFSIEDSVKGPVLEYKAHIFSAVRTKNKIRFGSRKDFLNLAIMSVTAFVDDDMPSSGSSYSQSEVIEPDYKVGDPKDLIEASGEGKRLSDITFNSSVYGEDNQLECEIYDTGYAPQLVFCNNSMELKIGVQPDSFENLIKFLVYGAYYDKYEEPSDSIEYYTTPDSHTITSLDERSIYKYFGEEPPESQGINKLLG